MPDAPRCSRHPGRLASEAVVTHYVYDPADWRMVIRGTQLLGELCPDCRVELICWITTPAKETKAEWVQVKPHGPYGHQDEGWIPRSVLEAMGVDCQPLDHKVVGPRGPQQGTVWFTAEQAEAVHRHPDYHEGPLPREVPE